MVVSDDLKWRAIVLTFIYDVEVANVASVLGVSVRSIIRWHKAFKNKGNFSTDENAAPTTSSRWPIEVRNFTQDYIKEHPCFYIEELQQELRQRFPGLKNTSPSTICRVLKFDLKLTRKILSKRAREAKPIEMRCFYNKLLPFYSNPHQIVFLDETSKDGRDGIRRRGWSARNKPVFATLPFDRGKRISVLAAMDSRGFLAWGTTEGTFDRNKFHEVFCAKIAPHLNPWPMPNSILVLDNARIHMYQELETVIHSRGALLFYLPPYCPHLNPIEVGFALLKRWLQRYANMAFAVNPIRVLDVAMVQCTRDKGAVGLYRHCGYEDSSLCRELFLS